MVNLKIDCKKKKRNIIVECCYDGDIDLGSCESVEGMQFFRNCTRLKQFRNNSLLSFFGKCMTKLPASFLYPAFLSHKVQQITSLAL